ncbi:MAG: hypothetical protein LBT83_09475 [Tannerella sp.]|jgi:hypothetical protein|nr:hypothetical protein [Tannerella sp.]
MITLEWRMENGELRIMNGYPLHVVIAGFDPQSPIQAMDMVLRQLLRYVAVTAGDDTLLTVCFSLRPQHTLVWAIAGQSPQ